MQKVAIISLLILVTGSQHLALLGEYGIGNTIYYSASFLLLCVSVFSTRMSINKYEGLILAYVLFLLAQLLVRGNEYGSDAYYMALSCWLLAFGLIRLLATYKLQKCLMWILISLACVEMLIGFGQLLGLSDNANHFFRMGAAFGNPGAFAGYISVTFPIVLALYLIYRKRKEHENISLTLLAVMVVMAYVVVMSASRGAWIAFVVSSAVVLYAYHSHYLKELWRRIDSGHKRIIIGVASIVVVLASVAMYKVKADSADGRAFIWKVAVTAPHKNILVGDGIGSFEANYGKWQRDYFAAGKGTEHEKYIADYVECAYNEFLETYIEQGIVGEGLFIAILCMPLCIRRKRQSAIYVGVKASYVGFLILCLVSYPLTLPVMFVHLMILIALLMQGEKTEGMGKVMGYSLKLFCLIAAVVITYQALRTTYGITLTQEGQERALYGDYKGGIKLFEQAYPLMSNDGTFLLFYGSALYSDHQYQKSETILKQAEQKSSNPGVPLLLGDCLKTQKKTDEAITAYKNAINTIPSRLYPRYKLAMILEEKGRNTEAVATAKEILHMKDKVPTTASRQIRDEMHFMITRLSNPKTEMPMK